jgi:hypothetical protein
MAAAMQPGVFAAFAILSSTGAGLASPALVAIDTALAWTWS